MGRKTVENENLKIHYNRNLKRFAGPKPICRGNFFKTGKKSSLQLALL